MDARPPIILLAAVLALSGCRDEQTALMAPPDPLPAGAAGADQAGSATAADSTTSENECDLVQVEIEVGGETTTVYLCRRETEAAGGSASADGDGEDGTGGQICWYWVVEYRIAGILVAKTEELLFCEDAPDPNPGGGGGGPSLTLSCPESATRGDDVTCSIQWSPATSAISNIAWEYQGDEQLNSKAGDDSWSGVAVAGGTFRVSATVAGEEYSDSAVIEVTERGGGAWIMPVSSGWDDAAVAECTNWDTNDAFGMTVSPATCHSVGWFEVDYSVAEGSGPWAGLYYVTDPDAPLVLRAALRPEVTGSYPTRTNRDLESKCKQFSSTLISVTMGQANINCDASYKTVYENAIDFAIQHEDDHMDAGVVTALFHNLYAQWDAIIGTSEGDVRASANNAADHVDYLVSRAIATADETGTGFSGTMWYQDGGWDLTKLTLGH